MFNLEIIFLQDNFSCFKKNRIISIREINIREQITEKALEKRNIVSHEFREIHVSNCSHKDKSFLYEFFSFFFSFAFLFSFSGRFNFDFGISFNSSGTIQNRFNGSHTIIIMCLFRHLLDHQILKSNCFNS